MATKSIFIPKAESPYFTEEFVTFEWAGGLNIKRRQLNVARSHAAFAAAHDGATVFEVSRFGSPEGAALSAFNLSLSVDGIGSSTVECFYQGSKVFADGGPYQDLYEATSMQAKKDPRIQGKPIGFELGDQPFALCSCADEVGFYDRLYLTALLQHPELAAAAAGHAGYSDIAFCPAKGFAAQSRSLAKYFGMLASGMTKEQITQAVAL